MMRTEMTEQANEEKAGIVKHEAIKACGGMLKSARPPAPHPHYPDASGWEIHCRGVGGSLQDSQPYGLGTFAIDAAVPIFEEREGRAFYVLHCRGTRTG